MGWSKLPSGMVCYRREGGLEIYDEAGLRLVMGRFLSNESRARYGDNQFFGPTDYLDQVEWFMVGLRLFYN